MILSYCTYACKTFVFLFVVFLVGYIMVKNERKIERFVDRIAGSPIQSSSIDKTQRATISSVFRNYLNREPTEDEIASFSRVMLNSNDVLSLTDAVKSTDEYKTLVDRSRTNTDPTTKELLLDASELRDSPLLKDIKKVNFDTRLDTYRKVIDVYNNSLERMPTNKELVYYSHRMLTDKEFTPEKLRTILEASNERKILERNQTNVVNAQLPGNITHAQMVMDVTNKYKSLYKVEPSQEVLDFLVKKYQEYKLDEKKLDKLILLINDIDHLDTTKGGSSGSKSTNSSTDKRTGGTTSSSVEAEVESDVANVADVDSEQTAKNVYNNPYIINIITSNSEDIEELAKKIGTTPGASTTVINRDMKLSPAQPTLCKTKEYEDPFYKALAAQQKAQGCKFNPDVGFNKDKVSEYQMKRNQDEISLACRRANYYETVDDGILSKALNKQQNKKPFNAQPVTYSYEPENAAPLDEARKTHVGSILPSFIYTEGAGAPISTP